MDKLLSCPFCGNTEILLQNFQLNIRFNPNFWIHCRKCTVGLGSFDTEKKAIAAWNRREGNNAEN